MEIYYLKDRWLEGPVTTHEIASLIESDEISDSSPAWIPTQADWTSCGSLLESGDTAFFEVDDPGLMTTMSIANQIDQGNLPSPRNLLILRMAVEQDLITPNQSERFLDELFTEGVQDLDVPRRLFAKGWIAAGQRNRLEETAFAGAMPKMIGGYEIIAELGRGAMGTTYKARQVAMDRNVALKVLKPNLSQDDEYVQRFEREAKMAAKLNHENIAIAYEVCATAGQHCISMEFVDGSTIARLLMAKKTLPEKLAVEIVIQVCRALDHAHKHKMIHRDISPKNIIITHDNRAKLIDMGLAKSVAPDASGLTAIGVTVGTPAYLSPEQALGKDQVDIRSDIYSLGCVLYEMISGSPPLVGSTPLETITLHIQNPIPPLKDAAPEASDLVCHVVQKMTATKPEDRYQEPLDVIDGFSADDNTVKLTLAHQESVLPVREQLQAWSSDLPAEICLPVDGSEYVHLIAQRLEKRLEEADVDPEFHGYAQTIFTELVANAFDHGCKKVTKGLVRIRLELNDAFFRLEVIDPGPGFPAREMLEKIKHEPLDRERRRGVMQILNIADVLTYSPTGNHVKAVLYRKSEGSGVFDRTSDGVHYVEIKGKGDLALTESFKRWIEVYDPTEPERVCLMVRTDWVSSMFVGLVGKLHTKLKEQGSALSVWPEKQGCYRIMQQLGVSAFVRMYDSLEMAVMDLRYANISKSKADSEPESEAEPEEAESPSEEKQAEAPKETAAEDDNNKQQKERNRQSQRNAKPSSRRSAEGRQLKQERTGFWGWVRDIFR